MNSIMGLTGRALSKAKLDLRNEGLVTEMNLLRSMGKTIPEAAEIVCGFFEKAHPKHGHSTAFPVTHCKRNILSIRAAPLNL